MQKGLTIGQRVKIPLNQQNYESNSDGGTNGIPLTHLVAKSETLFKIGNDLNVSAESLRKWNNLSSDRITPGTPLIVGYLKTDGAGSSGNAVNNNAKVEKNTTDQVEKNVAVTEATPAAQASKDEVSASAADKEKGNTVETKNRDEKDTGSNPQNSSTASVIAEDTALAVMSEESSKAVEKIETKAEPQKQDEPVSAQKNETRITQSAGYNQNPTAGSFEDIYGLQAGGKSENTKSGDAATFKSTSGWQDKKYYVLINDIAPGTILKISASGKVVYAKVLGSMPEMKENNGLLLRISNAAASELGIIDPKFPVEIRYFQ
jgi:LysM repeat protein